MIGSEHLKLAGAVYNKCIPIIEERNTGNLDNRIALKNLNAIVFDLTKKVLQKEMETFVGNYLCLSYSKYDYKILVDQISIAPHWYFVSDCVYCESKHGESNGLIFRHNDDIWKNYFPPNSWGCGCTVRNFREREVEGRILSTNKTLYHIEKNYDFNPGTTDWRPTYKKLFMIKFVELLEQLNNIGEEDES